MSLHHTLEPNPITLNAVGVLAPLALGPIRHFSAGGRHAMLVERPVPVVPQHREDGAGSWQGGFSGRRRM